MLGFAPIAASPIAGGGFSLVNVPVSGSASGSVLTFGGSALAGFYKLLSASGSALSFSGSATPTVKVWRSASGPVISFSGSGNLRLTGKPERLKAFAESYTFVAIPESFKLTAHSPSYTIKGS